MVTSPLSPYFSCRACRSLYCGVRPDIRISSCASPQSREWSVVSRAEVYLPHLDATLTNSSVLSLRSARGIFDLGVST